MAGSQSAGAKPTMRASTSPRGAAAADSPPVVLDGTAGAAGADPYHVAAVTTSATTRSSATPARPRRARGSRGPPAAGEQREQPRRRPRREGVTHPGRHVDPLAGAGLAPVIAEQHLGLSLEDVDDRRHRRGVLGHPLAGVEAEDDHLPPAVPEPRP